MKHTQEMKKNITTINFVKIVMIVTFDWRNLTLCYSQS